MEQRPKKRGRTYRGGKLKQFVGGLVSLFLLSIILYRVLIVSYPHPANRCIRLATEPYHTCVPKPLRCGCFSFLFSDLLTTIFPYLPQTVEMVLLKLLPVRIIKK